MMTRSAYTITPFFPTSSHQYESGGITVFRGSPIPHVDYGRGLGSSWARVVKPLAARAVRYAGGRILVTGIGILTDVLSVKTAAKCRASAAFQQAKQDVLTAVKRRRRPSTTTTTTTTKRRRGPSTTTTGKKRRRKSGQKGGRVMPMVRRRRIFVGKTTTLSTGISFPHTLRSCEDHCCRRCHDIRTSPEALRIVPRGELGFGTVSNPTHRHVDFKR